LSKKIIILFTYVAFLFVQLSACPLISENVKISTSKNYFIKSLGKKVKDSITIGPSKKHSKIKAFNLNRRFKPNFQEGIIQKIFFLSVYTTAYFFENKFKDDTLLTYFQFKKNKAPPALNFLS